MVVRMRHTKSHTANRRSHHALLAPSYVADKETQSVHLRHRVDLKTGMYKGKKVIDFTRPATATSAKGSGKAQKQAKKKE